MKTDNKNVPIVRGLNRTRSVLLEAIKLQTGILLTYEAERYFKTVDKWVQCNGIAFATLRLKRIYHIALNSLLDQPDPCYPNIATDRGFPRDFRNLRKFGKTAEGIQAILGLLGYYRCLVVPGQPDLSSITDDGPKLSSSLIQEIVASTPFEGFDPTTLDPPRQLYRSKMGPNGKALIMSMADLIALQNDPSLLESLLNYMAYYDPFDGDDLAGDIEELMEHVDSSSFKDPIHSRLAIKREGGGKTRVFAIVDYWTQCALEPLHKRLASILRTIENDCTFNQSKGIPTIKQWSKIGGNYSFDLSSATDRFPLILQKQILGELTGDRMFADNWANLMANRSFRYKGKPYKWSVGQPLGAYSSWPMFAVAHHIVVRYCAQKLGIKEPQYFLLGDDIVIHGKELADLYKQTILDLGVEISESKTLAGKPVEFAKRLFYEGVEVSPAPVKMIQACVSEPILIREGLNHLLGNSCYPKSCTLRLTYFIERFSRITRYPEIKLEVLIFTPFGSGPCAYLAGINPEGDAVWPLDAMKVFDIQRIEGSVRYKYLTDKYIQLSDRIDREVKAARSLPQTGLSTDHQYLHPVHVVSLRLGEEMQRAQFELNEFSREIAERMISTKVNNKALSNFHGEQLVTDGLDIPALSVQSFAILSDRNRTRAKHESRVIKNTFDVASHAAKHLRSTGERPSYLQPNRFRRTVDLSSFVFH